MSRAHRAARRDLSERIGYKFGDEALFELAVTHISSVRDRSRGSSYQRLEFLGDRVLGLAIAELLFAAFPKADEGELSRRLAELD
jgi:ribonuclease-3